MPNPLVPFLALWNERVGIVPPGRAGAALKPALDVYGPDRVRGALRAYLDNPRVTVRRLEYFVQDIVRYLPPDPTVPPPTLVDAYGDLTDDGSASYYGRR